MRAHRTESGKLFIKVHRLESIILFRCVYFRLDNCLGNTTGCV